MTTKSKRPDNKFGKLKTTLVIGSVAASLFGTKLLANQEPTGVAALSITSQAVTTQAGMLPQNTQQAVVESIKVGNINLEVKPIPTVIAPPAGDG